MAHAIQRILLICCLGGILLGQSCQKNTVQPPGQARGATLQSAAPYPFGAALDPGLLQNHAAYRRVAATEFSSLTPENVMKMRTIHPAATLFNWAPADLLVDFARQTNKRVHGHALLWHESVPDWVKNFAGDSAAWEELLQTHIRTVVEHYRGRVRAWDVVNEAFTDGGTLRPSIWLKHLGPDYVARCFQYAHAADPDALLFYNDYGHEYSPRKRRAIEQLVINLKQRNIPLHGLGLQMHLNRRSDTTGIATALREMAATGLSIHVSELDISMNPQNDPALQNLTPALAQEQAQKYRYVVRAYRALPKNQQYGITIWNVGDGDSWIRSYYRRRDWPLPFDDNYEKKPAYQAILSALQ